MDKVVDYLVYEQSQVRYDRVNRRLWILCIIMFAAFVISNGLWVYYESSFEDLVVTQENDDGFNNYIGNDGDITN